MKDIKELLQKAKRGPTDVVGIDIGSTGIKVVRIKKGAQDAASLVAADILPPLELPEQKENEAVDVPPLQIPPKLKGKYASFTVSGSGAVIKLLNVPGAFDAAAEEKIVGSIGVDKPENFRIGYKLITEGHGKTESRVLAVALPETEAQIAPRLFPAGVPAPFSIEIAGLATMTSFLHSMGDKAKDEAVGSIDFGAKMSTFMIFHKGLLALVRRFDFGMLSLLDNVQQTLGVDKDTAQGIVTDGAFDISQSVSEVVSPLIKQLIVSRDFVERRENCHISKMFVSGGLTVSRDCLDEIRSSMGLEAVSWNPLEGISVAENAFPENLKGQESRFSAAIGAVLGTFEET